MPPGRAVQLDTQVPAAKKYLTLEQLQQQALDELQLQIESYQALHGLSQKQQLWAEKQTWITSLLTTLFSYPFCKSLLASSSLGMLVGVLTCLLSFRGANQLQHSVGQWVEQLQGQGEDLQKLLRCLMTHSTNLRDRVAQLETENSKMLLTMEELHRHYNPSTCK